jgi:glyoxylase-like metal-dependent hydrolase (beta-lactamase superfamily II)
MPHQWSWQLLRAGAFRLDGGGMFGVVPKTLWSKMVQPDEQNRIPLQTNCLLLDDGAQKILIETGFGDKWSDKERGFFDLEHRTVADALREVSIEPAQINHVVLSHLHFDHAAGLTTLNAAGEATPVFPNATVHVQRIEWNDALANKSTMTRTYLRNHLDPIAKQVKLIDGSHGGGAGAAEILPGVFVWLMPGHTWGQQAIRFEDGEGVVAFVGDVLPTVNHVGLAFSLGYDMMPYQNLLSKKQLLEQAGKEDWRLALDHEPGPAVVHVRSRDDRPGQFELLPL